MTGSQYSRLKEIRDALVKYAERKQMGMEIHPSPAVQKKFENFTATQLEKAATHLQFVMDADNGQMAHAIIGVWHDGGESSVVQYVNGITHQPSKA